MVFELERVPGSRHILSSQLIETSPLPPPGDCSIGAYGTKCRYLSGLRPSATWEAYFPFLSPRGALKLAYGESTTALKLPPTHLQHTRTRSDPKNSEETLAEQCTSDEHALKHMPRVDVEGRGQRRSMAALSWLSLLSRAHLASTMVICSEISGSGVASP